MNIIMWLWNLFPIKTSCWFAETNGWIIIMCKSE